MNDPLCVLDSFATGRDQLPNDQNFPILFYGVIGKDMCEPDSMSFYNPIEIGKILELIQHLLSSKLLNVQQREIGVIAPFRKQVRSPAVRDKYLIIFLTTNLSSGSSRPYSGSHA